MLFARDSSPLVRVGLFFGRSFPAEHHCEVLRELLVRGRAMIREPFDIIGGPVTVARAMRVRVLSQGIGQPLAETPRQHGFLRLLNRDVYIADFSPEDCAQYA